ncbi:hypothetical protein N8968_00065 [Candidatus Pelagibacter sp.]|nr:hypothetical protein [Candidatus Pelagibacter sp.]
MIRQKKKLNFIKLTVIVIIASVLTFIITPVINNSNKPIYKAEFSLSIPPAFVAGSSWLFFVDYLKIENNFENMSKFLNIKFMENIDSNPCIKVSSFQNRLSIVTENFTSSETVKVVIISDQKKMLSNCYEYATAVLLEVERQQKDFLQTKYNFITNRYNYSEVDDEIAKVIDGYDSLLIKLLQSNYDLRLPLMLKEDNLKSNEVYNSAIKYIERSTEILNSLTLKGEKSLDTKMFFINEEQNILTKLNFDQVLLNKSLYSISPLVIKDIKFYSNSFLYPSLLVIIIFLLSLIVYFKEAISHLKKVLRFK